MDGPLHHHDARALLASRHVRHLSAARDDEIRSIGVD
jgi:hypothetical protein